MKNFKQITDNRYNEYPINDDLEIIDSIIETFDRQTLK